MSKVVRSLLSVLRRWREDTKMKTTNTGFCKWLNTFLSEKCVDLTESFEVEGPCYGVNLMTYENVVEAMKIAPAAEQKAIKTMFVKIDFVNGDVRRYMRHLAQAIAL